MSHRYLGRRLCLDASCRVGLEINNRLSAAWSKFNGHRRWLVDRRISLKLRMRLFEACVKPSALFALHTLPLKVADVNRLAATERRMKRCIVGWVRHVDDDWPTTMRRMRFRVSHADRAYPTKPWVESIWFQQWRFASHLHSSPCAWPRIMAQWISSGRRSQGRPHGRWDDHINRYCRNTFQTECWTNMTSIQLTRHAGNFSASMSRM